MSTFLTFVSQLRRIPLRLALTPERKRSLLWILGIVLFAVCYTIAIMQGWFGSADASLVSKKEADDALPEIERYDVAAKGPKSVKLRGKLTEISGLALTKDDKLFAHNDERGIVFEIDRSSGKTIKAFELGDKSVKEDFEGIAIVGERFFLVTSAGDLYEFREGADKEHVNFEVHKTFLSSKYDVEGLCYDPATNALLLACKGYPGKNLDNYKAVYSYSLDSMQLQKQARFLLPAKRLRRNTKEKEFSPSGIEFNPTSGTFFVIASQGNTIVEIDVEGNILGQSLLNQREHRQPEGITFASDGTLIMANEGDGKHARLVVYADQSR